MSHSPFLQSALNNRLEYELMFNDHSRVILATGDPNASYRIENISLEFDTVSNPGLARIIRSKYMGSMGILYDHVLRYHKEPRNKGDEIWNIDINVPCRSLKGVLVLIEDTAAEAPYQRDTEAFYNPQITKVEVMVEGQPNQLYVQGMCRYQQWDEVRRYFSEGCRCHLR